MNDHDEDALQMRATEVSTPEPAPESPDIVDAPTGRVSEEESGWKPLLPERKLGIWWALLTLVVAGVCAFLATIPAGQIWMRLGIEVSIGLDIMVLSLALTTAGCVATAGMLKLRGLSVTRSLDLNSFDFRSLRKVLLLFGGFIALELFFYDVMGLESGDDDFYEILWRDRGSWVFLLLGGCIAPGIGEELLFRGVLFSGIRNSIRSERWSAFIAIVPPAVLFGLLHTQYNWYTMVAVMASGALFGLAREVSGSLYPPMILHAAMNAMSLAVLAVKEG